MTIQLFNFLEDYNTQIVELTKEQLLINSPHFKEFTENDVQKYIEHLLEGYIDFMVTGQTDYLDALFQISSRMLCIRGAQFKDVFEIPLILSSVIRRLLFKEFTDIKGYDEIQKINKTLEETEKIAHNTAFLFLDVFNDYFKTNSKNKKTDYEQTKNKFDIDLPSFLIEPM